MFLAGARRTVRCANTYREVVTTTMRFPTRRSVTTTLLSSLSVAALSSNQNNSFAAAFAFNNMSTSTSSSSSSSTATSASGSSILSTIPLDNSWPRELYSETPENLARSRKIEGLNDDDDNRKKRPVYNGHYVLVKPTGLTKPTRVLVSDDVAYNLLKLTPEQVDSDDFVQFVSGNLVLGETWATPYALSIMGSRYTHNCPYGDGTGYGDGRAISIGEFNGYELQLKGAGTTPFHRGADGRAVLRSSIREFLASEAMHHLGIETTRALSLVKSEVDTSQRPWYSDDAVLNIPDMDDVRLANYPEEKRREIINQLRRTQKADPNILVTEQNAITCRVASSFTRIGHIDLFSRRVQKVGIAGAFAGKEHDVTSTREWKELDAIVWHVCKREFKVEAYDPFIDSNDIEGAASKLLELAATKIASMVTGWVRVGFAQGNFNADNCLVGGKTMDYGPFGWLEEFTPLFAKWTGSGDHFGFLNQPSAGFANYQVLVESVAPLIALARERKTRAEVSTEEIVDEFMTKAKTVFEAKTDAIFNAKLGLPVDADVGDDLWSAVQLLMKDCRTDWTLFWRQLTYVMRDFPDMESSDYDGMMKILEGEEDSDQYPFYEPLPAEKRRQWIEWIMNWRETLKAAKRPSETVYEQMRTSNPKYVLREWMLVDAYTASANGDDSILKDLYVLIQHPYDEGSAKQVTSYYRRAPESTMARGGTAFMS